MAILLNLVKKMSVEVLGRRDDGLRGLHSSRSMAFHNSTLSVRRTLPVPGAEEVAFHCAVEVAKGCADVREGPCGFTR